MKGLPDNIISNRETIAFCTFLFGAPIVYYLRDGIGLAPNNMYFTVALLIGPLMMILPFRNFKVLYEVNGPLYLITFVFLLFCMIHLYFEIRVPLSKKIYELFVIFIIMYIYFILVLIKRDVIENVFLEMTIVFCFIGSLLLIYYVYTNPLYVFGQRATINFRKEGEEFSGNPHIFSKVAFFGIVAGAILFKYTNKKILKFLVIISLGVFFLILILTQTMLAYLATFLFAALFFYYNITFRGIYKSSVYLFSKWYFWVFILLVVYKGIDVLNKNEDFFSMAYGFFENRLTGIFSSVFADKNDKLIESFYASGDDSANTRVYLIQVVIEQFLENLEENNYFSLVFGNGYKNLYVDVPFLEALDSFGIVGFIMHTFLHIYLIYVCFKEIRNPRSAFTEFIAYGFIYFMILNITGGYIVDYARWGYIALVARFITVRAPQKAKALEPVKGVENLV